MGEELTHCHRSISLCADRSKVFDLLGRKDVFGEEHPHRLHTPGQLQRGGRCQVLVNIVQELDLPTELIAKMLE